jgi:tetratricopeptide (TPR) repeat protein
MPKETQDRDAIVSKATAIASEEERDAFIAQACNNNAELRNQVEERVAEHFQARSQADAARAADTHAPSPEQTPEPAGENHAEGRESLRKMARKHPRALAAATVMLVFLLVAAVAGTSLAVWAMRKEKQAGKAEQEAVQTQEKAQKSEAATKGQLHQSEAARKAVEKERDRAKTAEKEAQRQEEDTKAILAFIKEKLLTAGRPADASITEAFWAKGQDKDLTLRKAADTAESQVADAFADRPLREASIREILALAYLNLGEVARAVKQYERALALREAMQGVNHADTAECRNKLAVAYRLAGRTAEAGRLFNHNLNSSAHATALAVRGSMLLSEKKPVEAELKLRACLSIRQKMQPDDWTTFDAKSLLGEALLDQKKYTDAEPLLLSGYKGMKERESKIPSADKVRLTQALKRLVQLYEAWDKKDQAAKWRKELETEETTK